MFPKLHISTAIALILSLSLPTAVMAQAKSKGPTNQAHAEQSPEMKKNMAEMYQKMADCMKTEKSMHDCHKEVMKDCPVAKATGSCPLMDGMKGMMNHGKMKHGKMKEMNKDMNMDQSEGK